ncbi:MAG: DJ-1/PfpI family protein [Fibrobacterales bacterium]
MAKALIIVSDGAEETELYAVADILVRADVDVTIAGVEALIFKGSRGLPVGAEVIFSKIINETYDLIYLPGGAGQAATMQDNRMVQDKITEQMEAGRLLAIICASPLALITNQLAKDKVVTSFPTYKDELTPHVKEWVNKRVVVSDNLITSQGPGTAIELGLKLTEILAGSDKRDEVAHSFLVG